LTITGLAADSSLSRGTNPRLQRRIAAVVAMFAGAALGSITLRHSVFMALAFSVVLSSFCSLALLISSRLLAQETQKRTRSSLIDVQEKQRASELNHSEKVGGMALIDPVRSY
jgi:hypothetical protein